MTITRDEAIKVLQRELDGQLINYPDQLEKAQKLGIEALKREGMRRKYPSLHWDKLLPGETEG